VVLRLSIDDEQEDDDIQGEVDALPFVINGLLVEQYGTEFSVTVEPHGSYQSYLVIPKEWKVAPLIATRFSMGA